MPMEIMVAGSVRRQHRSGYVDRERTRPAGVSPEDMMRRNVSLLLLASLVVTGAAPLAGERLLCPMPMPMGPAASASGGGCDACAPDAPAAATSLEAASCCSVAPGAEAETIPATMTAQRRGAPTTHGDGAVIVEAVIACSAPTLDVPSFESPPPIPATSPPPLSTQTTHLRN